MIKSRKFKKFYSVGTNNYYVVKYDNDLFLATESFLSLPRRFRRKPKEFTQTIKMLELTPSIMWLFSSILSTKITEVDNEFKDMCKYEKVDNTKLRNEIKELYALSLEQDVAQLRDDFNKWCEDFIERSKGKYTEEEIEQTIKVNESRNEQTINAFKQNHISTRISTTKPYGNKENGIIRKMVNENMEFLYSITYGANYKISYLYDLDTFGTITMYKVTIVKDVLKSVESFIYDRELIQNLLEYIENNDLI